jgi:hypothetical protein
MIDVADVPGDNVAVNVVVDNADVPNVNPDAVPGTKPVVGFGVGVTDGKEVHTYVFVPVLPPNVKHVNERVCV